MYQTKELTGSLQVINNLDFTNLKFKLQNQYGWTPEKCDTAEIWYKQFLTLKLKYPDLELVPNKDIDEIWHLHILDTKKYSNDCKDIFGSFFHHSPSYGQCDLSKEFEITKSLFRTEFGEDFNLQAAPSCSGSDCNGSDCNSSS
jgi:hypothetical protein